MVFNCSSFDYKVLLDNQTSADVFPLFRDENGSKQMWRVSPQHGRSYVVGKSADRFVVSKGNGLGYSKFPLLNTGEMGFDTWGLLLQEDAERDFFMGNEIAETGILTNRMEYVLELDKTVFISDTPVKPVLLQYSVTCPYRINDAPFMQRKQIAKAVEKWELLDENQRKEPYLIAADVLIGNLKKLHDREILYNAIHEGNFTWDLEMLDFELACSPKYPYKSIDYQRHVPDLFARELIQTYCIINYIAGVLRQVPNYALIDNIFNEHGFNLEDYQIR